VVGAETLSRIIDPDDRATCIVFGDAAAALVLEAAPDDGPGLLSFDLGCDGSLAGLLEVCAGGSRRPTTEATLAEGL
jgi:3-oxoacyl-[acyl-carrier-protein] synthase-3